MILVYRQVIYVKNPDRNVPIRTMGEGVVFARFLWEVSLWPRVLLVLHVPFQIEKARELPHSASDEVTVVAVPDLENESWLNITQSQPLLPMRRDIKMKSTQFLRTCLPVMAKSVSPFIQASSTYLEDRSAGPWKYHPFGRGLRLCGGFFMLLSMTLEKGVRTAKGP